jgi:octaprenyl-diphosphate synthase
MSAIQQLLGKTCLQECVASRSSVIAAHENAAWQKAERPFDRTHELIGDENINSIVGQNRLDRRDQHEIVGAQQFNHDVLTSRLLIASARPALGRQHGVKLDLPRAFGQSDPRREIHEYPRNGLRQSVFGNPFKIHEGCRPCASSLICPTAALDGEYGSESEILGVVIPLEDVAHESRAEALSSLVAGDMERVNQTILSHAGSNVAMIPEIANHLICSGGKRLRPMLSLATAGLCSYQGDGHVKLAAAVEFMHTATLLHDDVVDESDMRRGKLAARMLWGNEATVLVGDYLLGQAFKMMVEVGSLPCLDVLSSAAVIIAEGEVMQLAAAKDTETSEDDYLAVIRAKTAALFGAASEVGPILAHRPKAEIAACRGYGINLGIAFQLIDDALDYGGTSAKLGKNVGDDFREGKITLPVVLSFRRGSEKERMFWRRTLEKGEIGEGDLETAIATMHKRRGLEDTVERARHYGAMARDALELFPASAWKAALNEVAEFCIDRVY